MNLPNSLTMSRIFCVPLLIWILSPAWPWHRPAGAQELLACGIFILAFLIIMIGGALALYAWRAPRMVSQAGFELVSREAFLLFNNLLLVIAATVVFGLFGAFKGWAGWLGLAIAIVSWAGLVGLALSGRRAVCSL